MYEIIYRWEDLLYSHSLEPIRVVKGNDEEEVREYSESSKMLEIDQMWGIYEVPGLNTTDDDQLSNFSHWEVSRQVQWWKSNSLSKRGVKSASLHLSDRDWMWDCAVGEDRRSTWFSSLSIRTIDFSFTASSRGEDLIAGEEIMLNGQLMEKAFTPAQRSSVTPQCLSCNFEEVKPSNL